MSGRSGKLQGSVLLICSGLQCLSRLAWTERASTGLATNLVGLGRPGGPLSGAGRCRAGSGPSLGRRCWPPPGQLSTGYGPVLSRSSGGLARQQPVGDGQPLAFGQEPGRNSRATRRPGYRRVGPYTPGPSAENTAVAPACPCLPIDTAVNGHLDLPKDGHDNAPRTDSSPPRDGHCSAVLSINWSKPEGWMLVERARNASRRRRPPGGRGPRRHQQK